MTDFQVVCLLISVGSIAFGLGGKLGLHYGRKEILNK